MDGFGHKVVTVVVRTAGWFSFGFWCAHGRLLWCLKIETIPGSCASNRRRDQRVYFERSKGGWRYHPAGALGKNTRQFFSFRMTDEQRYPPPPPQSHPLRDLATLSTQIDPVALTDRSGSISNGNTFVDGAMLKNSIRPAILFFLEQVNPGS